MSVACCGAIVELPPSEFDVAVYKSSPAGIAAAVSAAQRGKRRIALIEPLGMIGGMGVAGGLALHDQQMSNLTMITGLAKVWAQLNAEYYYGTNTSGRIVNHPEIFVGERSFYKMIQDAKSIKLFMNCRLINVNMDTHNSKAIKSLDLLCGNSRTLDGGLKQPVKRTVEAAVYIDASYDGDIMVGTRSIDYVSGREAAETYNETLAGVQELREPLESFNGLKVLGTVSDINNTLIPYVFFQNVTALPKAGTADDKLMSFQHRAVRSFHYFIFLFTLSSK